MEDGQQELEPTRLCRHAFTGFKALLDSTDFHDVIVVGPPPRRHERRCHALLLAHRSQFFRKALLGAQFREGLERRVVLNFEDPFDVWPSLLEYFYTGKLLLTASTAMGYLGLAKRLCMAEVEEESRAFIKECITAANSIQFLRQAVQCEDGELQEVCTGLAARGFHTVHSSDVSGFPPSVVLEILRHPDLEVQCEEQVLDFVLRYVRSTQLSPGICQELFQQVRFPYLPDHCFVELQAAPCGVPRELLAEGALSRLTLMAQASGSGSSSSRDVAVMQWMVDHSTPRPVGLSHGDSAAGSSRAEGSSDGDYSPRAGSQAGNSTSSRGGSSSNGSTGVGSPRQPAQALPLAAEHGSTCPDQQPCSPSVPSSPILSSPPSEAGAVAAPAPLFLPSRPSYCSKILHGLPGGCRYVDVPCEHVWEELVGSMQVKASGVLEGRPRNVLSCDPTAYFSTNDCEQLAPWVEVHMPPNVTLLSLSHYSFLHGHHRTSYYRMRSWKTQAGQASCTLPGSTFVDLPAKWESSFDILARKGNARERFCVSVQPEGQGAGPPLDSWHVVRLVSTGTQQDGVHRLCLKSLRLYGVVRVDLLKQSGGMLMTRQLLEKALAAAGSQ